MATPDECPICGGLLLEKTKTVAITLPNPGLQEIETQCLECQQCKEDIFNEEQSELFAGKIDFIMLKTN